MHHPSIKKSLDNLPLESLENIAKNTFQLEISEENYSYQERQNRPVQLT